MADHHNSPPFALRLFYRTGAFHRPDEFAAQILPPHLTIHTWPSCTLAELSQHFASASTSSAIMPDPAIGTRLSFRLIYANTQTAPSMSAAAGPRFMVKDLGSVVVGDGGPGLDPNDIHASRDLETADASKTLADARFVVGDYVSVAVLPPLPNGAVAPASSARTGRGTGAGEADVVVGRAPRSTGALELERENGFGGRRAAREGQSRFDGPGRGGHVPMGEWRRGEPLPDLPTGHGRGTPVAWRRDEVLPNASYGRNRGRGRY